MIKMLSLKESIELLGTPMWNNNFSEYCNNLKINFRKLIKQFHGDKVSDDEGLKEIGVKLIEAYSVIGDAIRTGDLLKFIDSKSKKEDSTFWENDHKSWEDDLFASVQSVVDTFVQGIHTMKEFLMSLPRGTRTVCYKGLRFKVTTDYGREIPGREPERIWTIPSDSIQNVCNIDGNKNLLQLILQ